MIIIEIAAAIFIVLVAVFVWQAYKAERDKWR